MSLHPVIIITKDNMFIDYQDIDKIIKDYELYCPICAYNITMAVKKDSDYTQEYYNTIASKIYGGHMYGDVVVIPDEDSDDDNDEDSDDDNDNDDIEKILNHLKL